MYNYTFKSDREFRRNVDRNVRDVLRLLAKGTTNSYDIADETGLPMRTVASIKANATRGVYAPNVVAY
jgi:hypothetical protein